MTIRRILDLPPEKDNPRNSEGSFLTLNDGRIAFAYSRYRGESAHDEAYCEIAAIFSSDGGESFSDYRIMAKPDRVRGETNYMSVSLLRLNDGSAGLFYLVKHEGLWSEVVLRRSSDELETLGEEIRCAPNRYRNYYVINNDRILKTSDGRLIVPVALHMTAMNHYIDYESYESRARAEFYVSSDDGFTWRRVSDAIGLPSSAYSRSGLQEPGIVELSGGTLYSYFRTDLGRHYESVSIDGGENWFAPQPSRFTGPCSPLLIKQNPFSREYFAVWNPIPHAPALERSWDGGRSPLVIAKSKDGVHFSAPEVIEDSKNAGYCYPALHFTSENEALLSYCAGDSSLGDSGCLVRTRIVKLVF